MEWEQVWGQVRVKVRRTRRQLMQNEVGKDSIWQQAGNPGVWESSVEGPEAGSNEVEERPSGQRHAGCQAHGLQQLLPPHAPASVLICTRTATSCKVGGALGGSGVGQSGVRLGGRREGGAFCVERRGKYDVMKRVFVGLWRSGSEWVLGEVSQQIASG